MILEILNLAGKAAFTDFAISLIVILLGALVAIVSYAAKMAKEVSEKNSKEHDSFKEEILRINLLSTSAIDDIMKPTKIKADRNEHKINRITNIVGRHEGEIKEIKKKVNG